MIQKKKSEPKDTVFSILSLSRISLLGASGSSSSPQSPAESCGSDPHPQHIYFPGTGTCSWHGQPLDLGLSDSKCSVFPPSIPAYLSVWSLILTYHRVHSSGRLYHLYFQKASFFQAFAQTVPLPGSPHSPPSPVCWVNSYPLRFRWNAAHSRKSFGLSPTSK